MFESSWVEKQNILPTICKSEILIEKVEVEAVSERPQSSHVLSDLICWLHARLTSWTEVSKLWKVEGCVRVTVVM